MIILYFIIVFFIVIFNILIPNILERIKLENKILNSNLGKSLTKITCKNNYWFVLKKKVTGLEIEYLIDKNEQILNCNANITTITSTKKCGNNFEYNNRYHPCYGIISELIFYIN